VMAVEERLECPVRSRAHLLDQALVGSEAKQAGGPAAGHGGLGAHDSSSITPPERPAYCTERQGFSASVTRRQVSRSTARDARSGRRPNHGLIAWRTAEATGVPLTAKLDDPQLADTRRPTSPALTPSRSARGVRTARPPRPPAHAIEDGSDA
jgi:hypothetical protein